MTKFRGIVGFAGEQVQIAPGVYEYQPTARVYRGEVVRDMTKIRGQSDAVTDGISVNNSISILADAYAVDHIHNLKYVEWQGQAWTISSVEVQRPRIILSLGEVYHGPRGTAGSP